MLRASSDDCLQAKDVMSYCGVDAYALLIAAAKIMHLDVPEEHFQLVSAEGSNFDLPASSFDIALSVGVVNQVANPLQALEKMIRLVRKAVVLAIWITAEEEGYWTVFHRGSRQYCFSFNDLCKVKGIHPDGRFLIADFTPETDTFVLDLRPAYEVAQLQRLERTLVYSRHGLGALTVTDRVTFETPQLFGTALVTLGQWEQESAIALVIRDGDGAIRVEIDASSEFEIVPEAIDEDLRVERTATRLGINLKEPVTEAAVSVRITPLAPEEGDPKHVVRNGDFEDGASGWRIPEGGMSALSTEQAAGGDASLRIVDSSRSSGSNVLSDRMRLEPGTDYVLRGKVRTVSGEGVGAYVRLFGRRDEMLQKTSAQRRRSFRIVGESPAEEWQPFELHFRTTSATCYGRIWLHSLSASVTETYLDDLLLEVVPLVSGPPDGADWQLVFSDDFDGTDAELDATWEPQNGPSGHILCSRWR